MPELKHALGTHDDLTVFRKLKELDYLASYTHRGALPYAARKLLISTIADCGRTKTSGSPAMGPCRQRVEIFVNQLIQVCDADELHAEEQQPLGHLATQHRLAHIEMGSQFLYAAFSLYRLRSRLSPQSNRWPGVALAPFR